MDEKVKNNNGHEYVDLGLPSGTLWAKCNVGATKPTKYGKYFSWGDIKGYYDSEPYNFSWNTYKYGSDWYDLAKYNTESSRGTIDDKLVLDPSDDAVHVIMGGDWRMPTHKDFVELDEHTNNKWVEDFKGSGVNGYLFTSKTNGNTMFIPAAGSCDGSSVYGQRDEANLWSSSLDVNDPSVALCLYFNPDTIFPDDSENRYSGFSVRGVLNKQ